MDVGNLNDIPYAPSIINTSPPTILVGIKGDKGDTGSTGATGGGIAFSASNVGMDTVVDSFDISLSPAAEWQYIITSTTNSRVETLTGGWLSDGSQFVDDGGLATTDIGDTSPVYFSVNVSGTTAQLIMHVSTGTWNVTGSRIFIPVSGNGITLPTSLANGKIWIGDSTNQPTAQTFTGDITVTNAGVTSIGSGVIVNADINVSAAIAVSKFAPLTVSKAVVTNSSGFLTTSITAASKVDFLSNVTSDIQAQIDAIAGAGAITGAITTYVTSNATPSRAIVANAAGKLTTAITTDTEISYVSGVTSAIQTQFTGKVSKSGDSMSGVLNMGANKITNLATASNPSDAVRFDQLPSSSFASTSPKIINIGSWDMVSATNTAVAHGLSNITKIRRIDVIITNNSGSTITPLVRFDNSTNLMQGGIKFIDNTNITLYVNATGLYATSFYSGAGNRGWIVIDYLP
jgi:hypothetical protein